MKLTAILAQADDGTLGLDGKLPWSIPEDLRRFKALTTGHAIIMGRKTFDSIGRPLPKRLNVVVTREPNSVNANGVAVCRSPEAALAEVARHGLQAFVIGGAEIYAALWPRVTRVELTQVHREYHGLPTTTFDFERGPWREVSRERAKEHDDVEFVTLEREEA